MHYHMLHMSAVTAVLNILFKTPLKCLTLFTKEVTRNANTSSLTQTGYKPSTNHTAVLAIADLAIHYVFKEKLLLLHFQPDAMDNKKQIAINTPPQKCWAGARFTKIFSTVLVRLLPCCQLWTASGLVNEQFISLSTQSSQFVKYGL
jgi:hypothetical protein